MNIIALNLSVESEKFINIKNALIYHNLIDNQLLKQSRKRDLPRTNIIVGTDDKKVLINQLDKKITSPEDYNSRVAYLISQDHPADLVPAEYNKQFASDCNLVKKTVNLFERIKKFSLDNDSFSNLNKRLPGSTYTIKDLIEGQKHWSKSSVNNDCFYNTQAKCYWKCLYCDTKLHNPCVSMTCPCYFYHNCQQSVPTSDTHESVGDGNKKRKRDENDENDDELE